MDDLLAIHAPDLSLLARAVLVSVVLGTVVAVLGQSALRLLGKDSEDPAVSGSVKANLGRAGRMIVPFLVAFLALRLFTEALAWLAPDLGRAFTIALGSAGIALLAVPVTVLFGRWRSESDDKLSLNTLVEGLVDATRIALPIIVACAAAGMIAGVITLTGLGHELAAGLVSLGQGYLLPVMLLSMLACLILGIGLPTTANYVVTATLAAPALLLILQTEQGVEAPTVAMLLMAHMFVYYFGVMADITPPVCLAAYAASGISGGDPIRTGAHAVRIAVSGFVVPFMFVLNPELLLQGVTWASGTLAAASGAAGASVIGMAVVGYIGRRANWAERAILAVAGVLLLQYGWLTDATGLAVAVVLIGWHYVAARRAAQRLPSSASA
ncbi:TRAP transporter large permease subunit [Haloechinothrix sp. LS1_15]|nr:TRAP transporter large permease subunit [Haloechinothrix sp. LS1_15]